MFNVDDLRNGPIWIFPPKNHATKLAISHTTLLPGSKSSLPVAKAEFLVDLIVHSWLKNPKEVEV